MASNKESKSAKEPKSVKESNSSKTAHVMNLLSKNRTSAEPANVTVAEAPVSTPAASAQTPPILSSIQEDAAVSTQIRDALETVLEAAEEVPSPPKKASPPQQPIQAEQPPVQQAQPVPAEQPAAAHPEQQAQPIQAEPQPPEEESLSYVNVMQILVEEKAEKYMELFGLCRCPRCKIDVKALALNSLPNKYVVMSKDEFVPRITVYEGKFSSAITAQILHACKTVMESPRHEL